MHPATVTRIEDLMWLVYQNGTRLIMRDNGTWYTRAGDPWTEVPPMVAVQAIGEGFFTWVHTSELSLEFLLSDKGRGKASMLLYAAVPVRAGLQPDSKPRRRAGRKRAQT